MEPTSEAVMTANYTLSQAEEVLNSIKPFLQQRLHRSTDRHPEIISLCLQGCELIFKALLHSAGRPARELEAESSRLDHLLHELSFCEFYPDDGDAEGKPLMGACIREIAVHPQDPPVTVGSIVDHLGTWSERPVADPVETLTNCVSIETILLFFVRMLIWAQANIRGARIRRFLSSRDLVDMGCSPAFAKLAAPHSGRYEGDKATFLRVLETLLDAPITAIEIPDDGEAREVSAFPGCAMDYGNRRVEFDYQGDLLESAGIR